MGKRGPPPKPSELKKLEGTYRKDRAARNEFKPTPGTPVRPISLDATGRAEWERVTPELVKAGLLTMVDGAVLEGYCATFSMARKFQKKAGREPIIKVPISYAPAEKKGEERKVLLYRFEVNPAVGEARRCWALVRQLAAEFGFTPSSRTRVGAPGAEDEKDETANFLFGPLRAVDGGPNK